MRVSFVRGVFCALALIGWTTVAGAAETRAMMLRDGRPVWVKRDGGDAARQALAPHELAAARVKGAFEAMIAGPTPDEVKAGLATPLPACTVLDGVTGADRGATVSLTLPDEFLKTGVTPEWVEALAYLLQGLSLDATAPLDRLSVVARPASGGDYQALPAYLPKLPEQPAKPGSDKKAPSEPTTNAGQPPANGQPMPAGALSGASIFVNPGHGWFWDTTSVRWETQRFDNGTDLVEDLSNGEIVMQFLVPYLQNAGARVYTCRERDMQTNMAIVTDGGHGLLADGHLDDERHGRLRGRHLPSGRHGDRFAHRNRHLHPHHPRGRPLRRLRLLPHGWHGHNHQRRALHGQPHGRLDGVDPE